MDANEEDIADISLKHITPGALFGNEETTPSQIDNHRTIELLLKATSSAPEWLVDRWAMGQPPNQISRETGEPVDLIYERLKELEKAITEKTDN